MEKRAGGLYQWSQKHELFWSVCPISVGNTIWDGFQILLEVSQQRTWHRFIHRKIRTSTTNLMGGTLSNCLY
jgi:hypothetical protein